MAGEEERERERSNSVCISVSKSLRVLNYIPALSLVKSTDEEILDFASFLLVEDWNQERYATGD